jgi:sulfur relay (sulfurtransferase) complex TusBCD TusD component (DsrE family)
MIPKVIGPAVKPVLVHVNAILSLQLAGDLTEESVDTKYFLYTQGVLLESNDVNDNSELTTALLSCVVLFNLALVYHEKGLLGSDSKMRVALVLCYDCAKILEGSLSLEDVSLRTSFSVCCHLQAIMYNNMAHIHLDLCEYDTFRSCLERVALVASHGMHILSQISDFPLDHIYLNLFLMAMYPIAYAA